TLSELWEDVFLPPRALWLRQSTPLDTAGWDIRLEGRGLVVSSAQPPEQGDGLVLRCWDARGEAASGAGRFGRPVARATRLNADERSGTVELALADGGLAVPIVVEPYGMTTVWVDASR